LIAAIQSLLRLQEIDLALHAARTELAAFVPQRQAAAEARTAERNAALSAHQALVEAELRHRALEAELRQVDALVEKLANQLYEVTTKHALDALKSEQAHADEKKSVQEDLILALLEELEAAAGVLAAARERAREGEERGAREEAARAKREPELAAEIARLEALRGDRAGNVEASVIRSYDGARRKRLPAVVFAESKSCPVCRMAISQQKLIYLRAASELVHCGSCDRILYGEKVAEAERLVAGQA